MVKYLLEVKLDAENLAKVTFPQRYCVSIQQSGSDERKENIFISKDEEYEVEGSRGTSNFVVKWPGNKKQAQAALIKDKAVKESIPGDTQNFTAIACFECRGLDIVEFHPTGESLVVECANSGKIFDEVKLSDDLDWFEFDDEGSQSVGISSLEYRLTVTK